MHKYILVAAGGAIGTLLRHIISNIDYKFSDGSFPFGTFFVNISGSLIVGLLWGISERALLPAKFRTFALVGVLGGYTTFSTFGLESFKLIRSGDYKVAFNNIVLTNVFGLAFVFAGYFLANILVNAFHKPA